MLENTDPSVKETNLELSDKNKNSHETILEVIKMIGRGISIFLFFVGIDQFIRIFFENYKITLLLFCSIVINFWLVWEIILLAINLNKNKRGKIGVFKERDFGYSIYNWVHELHTQNRHKGVVDLRNKLSHTLHVLGLHNIRQMVGSLALESASILNDRQSLIEIYIDDLGWAVHMTGNDNLAKINIQHGISTSRKYRNTFSDLGMCILWEAKGLRHLAFLEAANNGEYEKYLDEAEKTLDEHPDQKSNFLIRDRMQLLHTKAEILCLEYGILKKGTLGKKDKIGITKMQKALSGVEQVAETFKTLGDLERYAKAQTLQVRMLSAIRRDNEAAEIKARLNLLIASSELLSYDRIAPI